MSDRIQISDFFGSYPDITDPLFNRKLSSKQEFAELEPDVFEPPPPRGGAFKHQKFAVRYLKWYDRLLLVHDPGTGKSCIIVHSAELFKKEHLKDPDDPTKINSAIILVGGPTLEANIENEIVCRCTDRVYETRRVLMSPNESVMRANITRELKTWYTIWTYKTFANKIQEFRREEDLEEYMSNKVIYVDEAHNIPTLKDVHKMKYPSVNLPQTEEELKEETTYETIFRAFHKGKRNKIVLATATPMVNSPVDIIPLMNLILPLPGSFPGPMPFFSEAEMGDLTLDQLEPYFRGRVSYIRAFKTGAVPLPRGDRIPGTMVHIKKCDMSEHQYAAYIRASGESTSRFYKQQKYASNFVFPDGDYGKRAFEKYIEESDNGYFQIKNDANGQLLRQYIRTEEGLAELSEKYAKILALCKNSFPSAEVVTDDSKGIIFVYFPDFVRGSGAVMFALCLREHGYEEFRETQSIFLPDSETNRRFGPCASADDIGIERQTRDNKKKRPRYALLTHETSKAHITTIFETLNSYENRYGQYIQVLIGARRSREGININNAVKMVMASSSWNASSNVQAMDRVFRALSHHTRIQEKRKRLLELGEIREGDEVTINVKTYNMASVYIGNPEAEEETMRKDNYNTFDARFYLWAERKDRLNHKILRFMKQSAIDCSINYRRNVRPTDIPGTAVCDYTQCEYECTGMGDTPITTLDRTTKILYYSDQEVSTAVARVTELFAKFYSLKIDQIYDMISDINSVFIDMALEKMIEGNVRLLDRMGFFGYLRESPDGVIYLEKDSFEIRAQPENTAYTSVLIGTQDPYNNSFNDYTYGLITRLEEPKIRQLETMPSGTPEFFDLLNSLSLHSKVTLLESVLYDWERTGETNDLYNAIVTPFIHTVYYLNEPVQKLREAALGLANRGKGRGRKPNPNKQPKMRDLRIMETLPIPEYDPDQAGERVIIHTLLSQQTHDRTDYGATSKYRKSEGQIRMLKMSEGIGWRDTNDYERMVYNTSVQTQINRILNHFEQYEIYGIMIPPENKLRLRDREGEGEGNGDSRYLKEGRVCDFWSRPELIDVLYRLGQPPAMEISPMVTRDTMLNYLEMKRVGTQAKPVRQFTNEKLKYFYGWLQSGTTRPEMCSIIQEYLERTGRIFMGRMPSNETLPPVSQVGSVQINAQLTYPDYDQAEPYPQVSLVQPGEPEDED